MSIEEQIAKAGICLAHIAVDTAPTRDIEHVLMSLLIAAKAIAEAHDKNEALLSLCKFMTQYLQDAEKAAL